MALSHRPILLTFLFALAGNTTWEMAQMYAYSGLPSSTSAMALSCGIAAIGDAIYITVLYVLGRKITGEHNWTSRLHWRRLFAAVGTSVIAAVVLESVSQRLGVWQYSERMPIIPALGVGLWPVLQLPVLTVVVFVMVGRIV